MSLHLLYQWRDEIAIHLAVGKWLALGLALFSIGVVLSERSTLSKVAEKLDWIAKPDSLERRFQRLIANAHLEMEAVAPRWVEWVVKHVVDDSFIVLVDETKLGDHLSVMMVGLAYRQRCIPLLWRCYPGDAYPAEGQVNMIEQLLRQLAQALPPDFPFIPLVEADRGIGTSSELVKKVVALGWHYLFRVQNQVHFRYGPHDKKDQALSALISKGQSWSAKGQVFKEAGWLDVWVHLIWDTGYDEPWCLITNAPNLSGRLYGKRAWQEQSFRDLKGGGWQWQRSQVWKPDHAQRLILILALAYAWMLSLGTLVAHAEPEIRRSITRGTRRKYSIFREGLRYFHALLRQHKLICLRLCFISDKPTLQLLS